MIFVDAIQEYPEDMIAPAARYAGKKWSHLWSSENDERELLRFALRIGLRPEWLQRKNKDFLHFDITPRKRRAAICFGAEEKSLREWLAGHMTPVVPC